MVTCERISAKMKSIGLVDGGDIEISVSGPDYDDDNDIYLYIGRGGEEIEIFPSSTTYK